MKTKNNIRLISLFILIIFVSNINILKLEENSSSSNENFFQNLRISKYANYSDILIDGSPGNLYNWSWAQSVGIVQSGDGSFGNPYIIEGINFTSYHYGGYGLEIKNTYKYFEVRNCFFYGNRSHWTSGLKLENISTSFIHHNYFLYNVWGINASLCFNSSIYRNDIREGYGPLLGDGGGIYIINSQVQIIYSNIIEYYDDFEYIVGIELRNCNNSFLWNNTIHQTGHGLYLSNCHENYLWENHINRTAEGSLLGLSGSHGNTIFNNTISNAQYFHGIQILGSIGNNISLNTIQYNSDHGIFISSNSSYNILAENMILNNSITGLYISDSLSHENLIYKNNFTNNTFHGIDNGINNEWNITDLGNYWDNYTGYDTNGDGIGETPYTGIGGGAGSIDYYPIVPSNETQTSWNISPVSIDSDWSWVSSQPWCSGAGTEIEPFVIMNVSINAKNSTSAFEIKNSDKFFILENCNFLNSTIQTIDYGAGLHLDNTTHGTIISNDLSNNNGYGISIINSINNNITGNIIENNRYHGMYIDPCENLIIAHNFANNNEFCGIYVEDGINISIHENFANDNQFYGIYLENCTEVTVDNNMINQNTQYGIFFNDTDYCIIDGNTINNNEIGIYLDNSDYNAVQNNVLTGNIVGIKEEENCVGNIFINNQDDSIKTPDNSFLLILIISLSIGSISVLSVYGTIRIRKSKRAILERDTTIFNLKKQRQEVTEDDITLSKERHFCLVHKGPIEGYAYICPNCGAYYCIKCIEAIIEIENKCWSCQTILDSTKPIKETDKTNEIKAISEDDGKESQSPKKSIDEKT